MATLLAVTTEPLPEMPAAGSVAPVLTGLLTKDPARRLTAEPARAGLARALAEPVGTTPHAKPPPATADAESRNAGGTTIATGTHSRPPSSPADPQSPAIPETVGRGPAGARRD